MNLESKQFQPLQDSDRQIRDVNVVWVESEGRLDIATRVRDKTFWERHQTLAASVKMAMAILTTFGICYGLWLHEFWTVAFAVLLRYLWVLYFLPQLTGIYGRNLSERT